MKICSILQEYVHEFADIFIVAHLNGIQFVNDEMACDWYTGEWALDWLLISTDRLAAIHANAFDDPAFLSLTVLELNVKSGLLIVHSGAFDRLQYLRSIEFDAESIYLTAGLFARAYVNLKLVQTTAWPNDINLNDMFATEIYRHLAWLHIENVALPQRHFRYLHWSNFSAFRRLHELYLINCGIEVIDEHAFDYIGHSLKYLSLRKNSIKIINVDMFRRMYETKLGCEIRITNNYVKLTSACRLIEVEIMLCPFERHSAGLCNECEALDYFYHNPCYLHRSVDAAKFGLREDIEVWLRVIDVRMAYANEFVAIHTNFTSKIRVLFVNGDAVHAMSPKCSYERALKMNVKCFSMAIASSRLHLDMSRIEEIRSSQFISITVIPILHRFGARPMHLMTIRQQHIGHWLRDNIILILFTTALITFGMLLGLGGALWATFIWYRYTGSESDQIEANENEQSFDVEFYDPYASDENGIPIEYEYYDPIERNPYALPNDYIYNQ